MYTRLTCVIGLLLTLSACSRVPSNVVKPDEMAELMADLQIAESAVESNFQYYPTDSSRLAVKQAVLAKHGVSQEMYDTTMMWYGAHLDQYMKVYEQTEQILQNRLDQSEATIAAANSVSISGDSVNVWPFPSSYMLNRMSATNVLTFDLKRDNNMKPGDRYTWRAKVMGINPQIYWGMVARYADGTTDTYNEFSYMHDGWVQISFYTDSTRQLTALNGFMDVDVSRLGNIYIDSMELIRNRNNSVLYPQRYRQRHYDKPLP